MSKQTMLPIRLMGAWALAVAAVRDALNGLAAFSADYDANKEPFEQLGVATRAPELGKRLMAYLSVS